MGQLFCIFHFKIIPVDRHMHFLSRSFSLSFSKCKYFSWRNELLLIFKIHDARLPTIYPHTDLPHFQANSKLANCSLDSSNDATRTRQFLGFVPQSLIFLFISGQHDSREKSQNLHTNNLRNGTPTMYLQNMIY